MLSRHNWEQIGECLNGPHIWKCRICGEWTRSFKKPEPNAQLIDPDDGEHYTSSPCNVEWAYNVRQTKN